MKLLLISLVIYSTWGCPSPSEIFDGTTRADLSYRLPRNVKPYRYEITLHPDLSPELDPATFNGNVTIQVTALENTSNITLKIRAMSIDNDTVSVTDSNNDSVAIRDIDIPTDGEYFVINLDNDLVQGQNYTLTIGKYEGTLNLQNAGFYLAKYWDEEGIERRFATTQFESTNARRAFPSFDEPEWKATFLVRLRRRADYITISNEEISEKIDLGDDLFEDVYEESAIMSTYLMAFIVSQYDFVDKGVQKVYATPEAIRNGWADYALDTGISTIAALEDFLNINYTLSKMDQVAIPDDYFSPGAMENWGLVTYRDSYLLFDEKFTTTSQLQRITTVIAHEFGHQWFGNLVTLSWWRYLWLNEGFATYFEYQTASVVQPNWRLMEQLALELQYAFEFDSLDATQPMNYETETGGSPPGYISYEKAGSVIRMTENFLTTDVFRRGLTIYLENRKFDIAVPEDLYSGWQEALGSDTSLLPESANVSTILAPWADQKGYPIVGVVRNYDATTISFTQQRFLLKDFPDEDVNITWPIPLNFMYSSIDGFDFSDTTADYWFTTPSATINAKTIDGFLIVNKQQTGYYRVNYDEANWHAIIEYLNEDNFTRIDALNRAQLLDDSFNLARSGVLGYEIPLSLSAYIARETDYIAITSFLNALKYLHPILAANKGYEEFKSYIINLLLPTSRLLGFEGKPTDAHVDKLNRVNLMTWLCDLGEAECRQLTLEKFHDWRADQVNNLITPDAQLYVYCGALRTGDQTDWNLLFESYQSERIDVQRTRILNALGCSGDEAVLLRALEMTLDPNVDFYKAADRQTVFASVYNSGSFGLNFALNFVKANSQAIFDSTLNLNTIITGISTKLASAEQLTEFTALLEELESIDPEASYTTALNNANDSVNWANANVAKIVSWLEEYNKIETTTAEDVDVGTTTAATTSQSDEVPSGDTDGSTNPTTAAIETTTSGSSAIIASLVLVVTVHLVVSLI